MNCTKLSDFEKQCPNVDCNTAKCPIFRKVVIPSNMGSDEEGQPYAPENGAYENALVYYEASGVSYIYSSDGIYTKIAQITGGQGEVISVNGKKGVVTITIDELDGLTADQIVSRINSAKAEDKAYTDAKIAQVEAEISTINSKIPAEASVSNQLADKTFVSGLVSDEASARELADTNLQGQIDAITSASDVVDVVGTYSELQAYDTQHLNDNDIVKVLVDETHDNAITYYRWTHSTTPYSWIYIGSQGPFYTKAESDTLLNEKADKSNTYTKTEVDTALAGKVDKVAGKGLSTNDFTAEEKTKLAGLENTVLESTTGQSTTAGMTQKAITDALASAGGGVKVLTTADYNLPTSNPTSVALWTLEPGVYIKDSKEVNLTPSDAHSSVYVQEYGTFLITNAEDIPGTLSITCFADTNSTFSSNPIRMFIVKKADGDEYSYSNTFNYYIDNLTSTETNKGLSANQGKVLKDLIDSLIIKGAGAPTTSTVGTVGKLYEDTTNGKLYQCTAVSGSTYTWEEVGGGSGGGDPVYSTVQTSTSIGDGAVYIGAKNANNQIMPDPSTTDNHRRYFWALPWDPGAKGAAAKVAPPNESINIGGFQRSYNSNCTTIGYRSRVDGDGNTCFGWQTGSNTSSQYSTFIGANAMAMSQANYQTALGYDAQTNAKSSVALGAKSTTTAQGEVSIGGSRLGTDGYNNTSYRKITNVYDGENAHDAATLAQGNTLASSAPTTSTVGVVGQLYTDTSTGKLYHCTAASGGTYTWSEVGGGSGGGASWGSITGTLSDQTDLQSALDDKQDTLTVGSGISIVDNVISATGGGGDGIKVLTSADYNWNSTTQSATEPYDSVAFWRLTPGIYTKNDSNVTVYYFKSGATMPNGQVAILNGSGSFGREIFIPEYALSNIGGSDTYKYGRVIIVSKNSGTSSVDFDVHNSINNLTTTSSGAPLDAHQGKVLNDKIVALEARIAALEGNA